ncbi:hypothetical protein GCM10007425_18350 [Lysinibacillus alkalisoli]|uniref:Uncharacterized protein n=1 Tax=Lysinibacillus alkalisoli TaxID=1911548 RepID=A0A917LHJ3_9BACI|nr:hypothetical protein GCM10007425_18350 [Lysinibacillus alkalisoli]
MPYEAQQPPLWKGAKSHKEKSLTDERSVLRDTFSPSTLSIKVEGFLRWRRSYDCIEKYNKKIHN